MKNTQSASLFPNEWVKAIPQQLRMYMTHPACGTTQMFRVGRSLEAVMRKEHRSALYETSCEKCGGRVQVEIAWYFLSTAEQEREAQLELVSEETLHFMAEVGVQKLSAADLAEIIARARKKWQGGPWTV